MSTIIKKCPACGENLHKRLSTPKFYLYDCHNCQLLSARIKKKSTSNDYYEFFEIKKFEEYYKNFRKKTFKKNWKEILMFKKNGLALDIGASVGWFLDVQPKGWIVKGIEKYISAVPAKYKKDIKPMDIFELANTSATFDLVTLWNVVEHLNNPNKALKIIHERLKKDGVLAMSFPNSSGLISRISYFIYDSSFGFIRKQLNILFQIDSASPHLFHFNANNMKLLLQNNSFEVLSIGYQPIIDPKNIDKRIQIEGKNNSAIAWLAKVVASLLLALSSMFNMHDEVVIYSRKI